MYGEMVSSYSLISGSMENDPVAKENFLPGFLTSRWTSWTEKNSVSRENPLLLMDKIQAGKPGM